MYHLGFFVPRESLVEAAKTRTQRSRYSGLPAGQLRGLAMDTKKAPEGAPGRCIFGFSGR